MNKKILTSIAKVLVDQNKAKIIVPVKKEESGYWFGGGNMISDENGMLYICGRYRNSGDSRTGLGKGERGKELTIFKSMNKGKSFEKIVSFEKSDLNINGWEVLSIEGSAIHQTSNGVELYVSTEKVGRPFVDGYSGYHKQGTGTWTIERITAPTVEELDPANLRTVLECREPQWFNVKDPFIYHTEDGDLILGFCSHPFNWASSNSGFAILKQGADKFSQVIYDFFPRGFCWDVGITRATCFINLPKEGAISDKQYSLCFYDGGEAMRKYPQHDKAVVRPRGYSCEELGGVGFFTDYNPINIQRLSVEEPILLSPFGSGSSRYVDILETDEEYLVTWQQSQVDESQPLVLNRVKKDTIRDLINY